MINKILKPFSKIRSYLLSKRWIGLRCRNIAMINFKLGLVDFNAGRMLDAKFRFLCAKIFLPEKSPTLNYFLSLLYYKEGNIRNSIKYIKKMIESKQSYRHDILSQKMMVKINEKQRRLSRDGLK